MLITLAIQSTILFISTFILLKFFIHNAHKVGLMDVPNARSAHKTPVARGAGMVFGFVFLVSLFFFNHFTLENSSYCCIFASLSIVFLTGVYDDFKDISSRKKFLFIIVATTLAFFDGFSIDTLGTYFGYEIALGFFALPFTIFAVVGFTNALNLTDGLDGLAGSISVVILSSLLYLGFENNDTVLIYLPILLIAPLLAFLWFNWFPAKVFMGDSGSLFLGFSIAILSIYALEYINPTSILFLAAIPLLDTLIVMKRRKQRGQSLFVADKNHLHHILLNFKKDKLFTVASLIKLQVLFSLIFIQIYNKSDSINLVLFTLLFLIFFNLFDPRMNYRKKKKRKRKQEPTRQEEVAETAKI